MYFQGYKYKIPENIVCFSITEVVDVSASDFSKTYYNLQC